MDRVRRRRRELSPDTSPNDVPDRYATSSNGNRRSYKRRKLDDEPRPFSKPPIKYGHYGQVEAGKLQLEIISNDGGEHVDPRHTEMYLGANNILRSDRSVFCSERSSAGVVLGHADGTPFCLEKLQISGPEHGFTAP
jgi:hypothetical protein